MANLCAIAGGTLAVALLAVCVAYLRSGFDDSTRPGQQGACRCLNWREAYRTNGVGCGRALEYYLLTGKGVPGPKAAKMVGEEFCGKFFQRIDASFCVNVEFTHAPTTYRGRQWCYVSSKCTQLGGGKAVEGSNVSWRFCAEGDEMLRKKMPPELDHIRGTKDLDLGLIVKFAYPIWQRERWPAVQKYFLGAQAAALRAEHGRADLEEVVRSGEPMLFDSKDEHPPFHIIVGSKIYQIIFAPFGRQNYVKGKMGDVTKLLCLSGCDGHHPFR